MVAASRSPSRRSKRLAGRRPQKTAHRDRGLDLGLEPRVPLVVTLAVADNRRIQPVSVLRRLHRRARWVVAAAQEAIATGQAPKLLDFGVTNEMAWEVGLACGPGSHPGAGGGPSPNESGACCTICAGTLAGKRPLRRPSPTWRADAQAPGQRARP